MAAVILIWVLMAKKLALFAELQLILNQFSRKNRTLIDIDAAGKSREKAEKLLDTFGKEIIKSCLFFFSFQALITQVANEYLLNSRASKELSPVIIHNIQDRRAALKITIKFCGPVIEMFAAAFHVHL